LQKNVGLIGLGNMGTLIAKNLANANFNVKVWNRTIQKAKESGLPYTNTLEGLVLEQDIIITILSDAEAVEEVYSKILELPIKGKVFIDMTTVKPEIAKKLAERFLKKGANFLEAPVLGNVLLAEKGMLTILVSGDEKTYKELLGLFSVLGKEVFYLGDYGISSSLKLINNSVLATFMGALSEAIVLAEKIGINRQTTIKVLENGAGKSAVLEVKKDKILNEDYSIQFSTKLLVKDLRYFSEILDKNNLVSPYFSITNDIYKGTYINGYSENDFCSVLEILKKLNGIN